MIELIPLPHALFISFQEEMTGYKRKEADREREKRTGPAASLLEREDRKSKKIQDINGISRVNKMGGFPGQASVKEWHQPSRTHLALRLNCLQPRGSSNSHSSVPKERPAETGLVDKTLRNSRKELM